MSGKRPYKFTMPDGSVGTEEDIASLPEGEDKEYRKQSLISHMNMEAHYERKWRNQELTNTDWMLVADATYGGEPLTGSQYLEDIKAYRQSLREYNLTTDDRPEKPDWFN